MTENVPEPGLDPDLDWSGWGEEDWDDEKVRADLMNLIRQAAAADGSPPEVVERRMAGIRRWAAREAQIGDPALII